MEVWANSSCTPRVGHYQLKPNGTDLSRRLRTDSSWMKKKFVYSTSNRKLPDSQFVSNHVCWILAHSISHAYIKKKILLPSIVSWCKGSLESRLQSRPWSIAEFDRISFAGIRMRSIGRAVRGILFTFRTSISSIATTNDRGRTDGRVSTLSLKILAYPRAISSLVSLPRKYTRHMPTRRVSLRIVFPRKLFFFNLYPPHSSAPYSRA